MDATRARCTTSRAMRVRGPDHPGAGAGAGAAGAGAGAGGLLGSRAASHITVSSAAASGVRHQRRLGAAGSGADEEWHRSGRFCVLHDCREAAAATGPAAHRLRGRVDADGEEQHHRAERHKCLALERVGLRTRTGDRSRRPPPGRSRQSGRPHRRRSRRRRRKSGTSARTRTNRRPWRRAARRKRRRAPAASPRMTQCTTSERARASARQKLRYTSKAISLMGDAVTRYCKRRLRSTPSQRQQVPGTGGQGTDTHVSNAPPRAARGQPDDLLRGHPARVQGSRVRSPHEVSKPQISSKCSCALCAATGKTSPRAR